jgi:hypothetical protein
MRLLPGVTVLAFAISTMTPAAALGPVSALPDHGPFEQAKYKAKWKDGGCKYKYKADKKGFKEEYKCK